MKQLFMQKNMMRSAKVRAEDVPAPRCGASSVVIANRHSLISAGTESTAVRSSKRDMVVKAIREPDIRQSVVEMLVDGGVRRTADRVHYEMTKWTALGYSGAGLAIEVGCEIDGIKPGDLVAYGGQGHAEIIRAPKNLCVRVPDGVSTREAAFVALGSIALQAVRRANVQVGETVAVLGLGLVGQLVSQLLHASGARVIGSDVIAKRLELAGQLGLEQGFAANDGLPQAVRQYTDGVGVDRVLLCASTSSRAVIEQAVEMARDRGRIVVVGRVNLDIPHEPFYMKELDLVISRSYGPGRYDRDYEEHGIDYPIGYIRWTEKRNMAEFLRLIQAGKVDVKSLITHEFLIGQAAEGYDSLISRPAESLAVLLKYDEGAANNRAELPLSNGTPALAPAKSGNVAVIGCGAFARQFHLPNLKKNGDLRLHTLVASSAQSAKEMAVRYGAVQCATDPSHAIEDPEIDAVMIFTRDKTHASLAAEALHAGKHVFCEKPLGISLEDCELLLDAAQSANAICMTGFNRRFAPLICQAKDVLDTCHGPKMIHYRVNAGAMAKDEWVYDPEHAAGRIVGEACHFVDLFRYLIGAEPVSVSAHCLGPCPSATRLEDVTATFEFSDESTATLQYTAKGSSLLGKERLEVFCDGTAIMIDDFKRLTIRGKLRVDVKHRRPDKGHAAELEHFADVLMGRTQPLITLQDGIVATMCCLKLIDSARNCEQNMIG